MLQLVYLISGDPHIQILQIIYQNDHNEMLYPLVSFPRVNGILSYGAILKEQKPLLSEFWV